jgi:hypothetical protein
MMQKLENTTTGPTFDAHNFLRTFRHLRPTKKLDLFFDPNTPMETLIHEFNRFLMIEIFNETVKDQYDIFDQSSFKKSFIRSNFIVKQNMMNILFGFDNSIISSCTNCGLSKNISSIHLFYDSKKSKNSTFDNLLKQYLTNLDRSQTFCSNCKNITFFEESNTTFNLPTMLNINLPKVSFKIFNLEHGFKI